MALELDPSVGKRRQQLLTLLLSKKGIHRPEVQVIPRRLIFSPCPLSFAQQRLWLLDQLGIGGMAYNISTNLRLAGMIDAHALQESLNEIMRRHEVLRTRFVQKDGLAIQEVLEARVVEIEHL